MSGDGEAARAERRSPRPPDISRAGLERAALGYLERFDSSVANLRRVLRERIRRARQRSSEPVDAEVAKAHIEELLVRYQESGLLDDRRFGANLLLGLRRRGVSSRAARLKLLSKGVAEELVLELMSREAEEAPGDAEFDAALAYVKKRRLGHYRRAKPSAEAAAVEQWQEPERLAPGKSERGLARPIEEHKRGFGNRQGSGRRQGFGRQQGFGRRQSPEARLRDKDLAALARRGFSFDVARRALDTPPEE